MANVDTLTAALALGDACALNFANLNVPGGRCASPCVSDAKLRYADCTTHTATESTLRPDLRIVRSMQRCEAQFGTFTGQVPPRRTGPGGGPLPAAAPGALERLSRFLRTPRPLWPVGQCMHLQG